MGALVKVGGGAITIGAVQSLPPAIQRGITDITVAFQAGVQRSDSDRVRSLQLYAEAVSTFHPAVVERTLRWLLLNNPRNPFPPTPQDVHEACGATARNWHGAVLRHFGLSRRGFSYDRYISSSSAPRGAPFGGPAPLTAGCALPADYVLDLLRRELSARRGDGAPGLSSAHDDELIRMTDSEFAALPEGVLEPEYRKQLLAQREREEERRSRYYLDAVRSQVLMASRRHGIRLTDEEVLARAQAEVQSGRSRRAMGVWYCDAECAANSGCAKCAARD